MKTRKVFFKWDRWFAASSMAMLLASVLTLDVQAQVRRPGRPIPHPRPPVQPLPPQPAFEEVHIQLGGREFVGNSTLHLKMLAQGRSRLPLAEYDLVAVHLGAKSQMGRATAQLQIGARTGSLTLVPGNPVEYNRPSTPYHRVVLHNPDPALNLPSDVWQVDLRGNVKLQLAVLVLKQKRQLNGGAHLQSAALGVGSGGLMVAQARIVALGPHSRVTSAVLTIDGRTLGRMTAASLNNFALRTNSFVGCVEDVVIVATVSGRLGVTQARLRLNPTQIDLRALTQAGFHRPFACRLP